MPTLFSQHILCRRAWGIYAEGAIATFPTPQETDTRLSVFLMGGPESLSGAKTFTAYSFCSRKQLIQ